MSKNRIWLVNLFFTESEKIQFWGNFGKSSASRTTTTPTTTKSFLRSLTHYMPAIKNEYCIENYLYSIVSNTGNVQYLIVWLKIRLVQIFSAFGHGDIKMHDRYTSRVLQDSSPLFKILLPRFWWFHNVKFSSPRKTVRFWVQKWALEQRENKNNSIQ